MIRALFFLLIALTACRNFAQDTLKMTLREADSIFLRNNFAMLAARFNIDRQNALLSQAKVYPNPVFTADFNLFDPQNNKVLHTGETGQKAFQIEQLIVLGGKRKSEIELARSNARIAELEFEDLIRQLKYQLHASLFTIHQQKNLLDKYGSQLALIDTIVQSFDRQAKKGNIPLKESIRLKSVYLNLNNQRSETLKNYYRELARVQLILQVSVVVQLNFDDDYYNTFDKRLLFKEACDLAYQNRPDYKIDQKNRELAWQYLDYQKKRAIPDIILFAAYDQRGGAFVNQMNAGIAIPLPVWDRNRGNIKAAAVFGKMADLNLSAARQKIENELRLGFQEYQLALFDYNKTRQHFSSDFDEVVRGITINFQKRNITLMEFVDFFESYNIALNEVARARMQLAISSQQLNYLTASELFANE